MPTKKPNRFAVTKDDGDTVVAIYDTLIEAQQAAPTYEGCTVDGVQELTAEQCDEALKVA